MKTTAKQKIINRINETGKVDNYWCIDNRITTRLGAVIFKLRKEGYDFKVEMDNKNCNYIVNKKPDSVYIKKININDKIAGIDFKIEQGLGFAYKVTDPVWNL